nr:hypothetical protein [Flavobacterium sp. ASV13]
MKRFIFYILLLFVLGCTRYKSFSNKYFSLTVPNEFIIDSINLGEYNLTKFPDRQLISKGDSDIYSFSFYSNKKNFRERKGVTISNSIIENKDNKDYKKVILEEIRKQNKFFSQGNNKNYEIIIPLKDTVIKNRKYSYFLYQYDYSNNTEIDTIKKGRLFIERNEKIHDLDLKFDSKDNSSMQKQFNELLSIVETIKFKK